ncbi:ABC transporter ATP-binding protein [Catenulispora pinisilvae]|uniref:ABC transporter ATP-binding protein n=1 Tax=Catenulispora pinisilvae TaxID=2705253 RepID=UPI001890D1E5|nr:ABC transporter ATP-binding protein [Catenulispora pinisilvae]
MAQIRTVDLTKTFADAGGGVTALDALTLTIEDGEFFALLGPSGCGKTTLLRTLAGLETPSSGAVHIGEADVTRTPPGKRGVAMVFQDYALFPHMTVTENIAYPLRVRGVPKAQQREAVLAAAADLGLTGTDSTVGLLDRRPEALSGGQQQRVALARATAAKPSVFLFDEPLSNLDARLRLEARTFLKRLQRELAVTTVFVTHDQAEALALADRIAVMQSGRIRQLGTPREVYRRPANTFVASFIGSTPMNLLEGVVRDGRVLVADSEIAPPDGTGERLAERAAVVLGARPEYFRVSPDPLDGAFRGTVEVAENLGSSLLLTLDVSGTAVQVVVAEEDEPEPRATLWALPRKDRTLLYADGELVG